MIAILFVLGFGLRLWRFLLDRSLWLDEVWLANNISSRNYAGLFDPLTDDQEAPVGYLVLVKLLTQLLGESEYVWRTVALLAGLSVLPLVLRLSAGWLTPRAQVLSFAIVALSPPLIHYTCETKPYALDVFVSAALMLAWRNLEESGRGRRQTATFALAGALSVWLSYPSVFVLGGLSGLSAWGAWRSSGPRAAARASIPSVAWIASFALLYALVLRNRIQAPGLKDFWSDGFMPLPPVALEDLRWYPRAFFGLFREVVGIELAGLAGALFLLGLLTAARQRIPTAAAALSMLGLALLASGLGLYPFQGRLALWSGPLLVLPIAAGADLVMRRVSPGYRSVGEILVGLLLLYTVRDNAFALAEGRTPQGIQPVLNHLEQAVQPGDELLLGHGVLPTFEYYASERLRNLPRTVAHEPGRDLLAGFMEDALAMRGRGRVWVLFSHFWTDQPSTLDRDYLAILRRLATELDACHGVESSAYLFQFADR